MPDASTNTSDVATPELMKAISAAFNSRDVDRIVSFFTVVLLASSAPVWWAERGIDRSDVRRLRLGLALGWIMGAAFLTFTMVDFARADFGWTDNAYASIVWTTVGLHLLHLIVGELEMVMMLAWALRHGLDKKHARDVRVTAVYWYWVVGTWVVIYAILFLGPRFF